MLLMMRASSAKDLLSALAIGLLLAVPVAVWVVPAEHELRLWVGDSPRSDEALELWLEDRTADVTVQRGDPMIVRYTRDTIFDDYLIPPWDELGYEVNSIRLSRHMQFFGSPMLILMMLTGQIGFAVVVLARRRELGTLQLGRGRMVGFLAAGGLGAAAIILCDLVYSELVLDRLGLGDGIPPWLRLDEMARTERLLIAPVVVLVAPVCEEFFFRGLLFGRYQRRGQIWAGAITTSLVFAAVHMVPVLVPVYFAAGLILAGLYHRTGSLGPPIVAHSLNNLAAVLVAGL